MRDLVLVLKSACTDRKSHDDCGSIQIFGIPWKYTRINLKPLLWHALKYAHEDIVHLLTFFPAVKIFVHLGKCHFLKFIVVRSAVFIYETIHIRLVIRHKAWHDDRHGVHLVWESLDKFLCNAVCVHLSQTHCPDICAKYQSLVSAAIKRQLVHHMACLVHIKETIAPQRKIDLHGILAG